MSIARHLRFAALGALIALGAACSDDPSGPRLPADGTFRIDLSGDYAAKHGGQAIFGVDGDAGHEFFAVLLGTQQDDMANLVILRSGTTRLELGTHQIANTSDEAPESGNPVEVLLGVGTASSSTVGFFDGKSGTIDITKSTADIVAGTFDLVVEGLLEEDGHTAEPATLRVTGAFTAEAVQNEQNARMQIRGLRMQRLTR